MNYFKKGFYKMKNTITFLTMLFAVVKFAIAQTNELPSDADALNEQIISDQVAIANAILNQQAQIENMQTQIENMQKQTLSNTKALNENTMTNKTARQRTNGHIASLEKSLNIKIKHHQEALGRLQERLDELNNEISQSNALLRQSLNKLENKIATNEQATSNQLFKLDNSLSKNTRNWIVAVGAIAFLSMILFLFLRIKIKKEKNT